MISYIQYLDELILIWIQTNLRFDSITPIMKFITKLGDVGLVWILLALILICIKKYRKIGITILLCLFLCFIVNNLCLKNIINRARPYTIISNLEALILFPHDPSFPSGHTANAFAAATGIYLMFEDKQYGRLALLLATLIGFSRLYLGVHYLTDVLAGMLVGIMTAIMVTKLVNKYYIEKNY